MDILETRPAVNKSLVEELNVNHLEKMSVAAQIALWADRLRDISAMGLRFTDISYDRTRYQSIQDLAMEMYALAAGVTVEDVEPLRSPIFTRPTPIAVGDGAVIDPKGRILLMQRVDDQKWALPGGALEVGETPAEGVVREVFEETGVRCQAVALVGVFDSRLFGFNSRHHLYAFTFLCQSLTEIPPLFRNEETLNVGWFAPEELPEAMHPGHLERIPEAFRVWQGDLKAYFDWK
jgi:ADP-ribose pyrophosphatase YjhB (NUDIX family)